MDAGIRLGRVGGTFVPTRATKVRLGANEGSGSKGALPGSLSRNIAADVSRLAGAIDDGDQAASAERHQWPAPVPFCQYRFYVGQRAGRLAGFTRSAEAGQLDGERD